MKKFTKAALYTVGGTALALGGVAAYACHYAIDRSTKTKPDTDEIYITRQKRRDLCTKEFMDLKPEDITIKSVDSLNMKAWLLSSEKPSKRFVIAVHGYRCNGLDEFSLMTSFYHNEMGYNYLLPDLTSHGRSEGKKIGFGAFDSKNILLWVDYLINRFGEDIEIILHGISMGAATVLLCNEMSPPDQVKLIIEDCGYTSAYSEMKDILHKTIGLELAPVIKLASGMCKISAGYFFEDADPLKNMKRAKNPILFIHGEADSFVPFSFGKELYEACPTKKDCLWVPDTIHAFSYYNAKEKYEEKVKSFINEIIGEEKEQVPVKA